MMNICILAPENTPSWGGVGSYTYNLIRSLPKENEIHVLTIGREVDNSFDDLFREEHDNVHIHKIVSVKANDTFFYNLRFQLSIFSKLKKFSNLYNFEIIHSHSGHMPHLFSQFQSLCPMVVTVHSTGKGIRKSLELSNYKTDATEFYTNFFSKGIEFFEKINFKKADCLFPVSESTLREINNMYGVYPGEKAKVINTAVDVNKFHYNGKELSKKPVILFAGRFYAVKGFETFLDSIEIIVKKGYFIKPFFVGRGNNKIIIERLSSLMSPDDFSILGLVEHNDMPYIFSKVDILVVPSMHENCPTVILEGMSCGKIVVASNVGGIPEIIRHGYNGFLFEKGNSMMLAEILIKLIEGTIDVSEISKNARQSVVKNYNWEVRGKEIYAEYQKILNY